MRTPSSTRRVLSLIGVCGAVFIGYYAWGAGPQLTARNLIAGSPLQEDPTPTPHPDIHPIFSPADAIDRSLDLFPDDHAPHAEIARLLTLADFEAWSQQEAQMGWTADTTVWLVAILGADVRVEDLNVAPGVSVDNDRQVAGGFYL